MLYATAAVLEGCSFVNGGSQNTMCGALFKLAEVTRQSDACLAFSEEVVFQDVGCQETTAP